MLRKARLLLISQRRSFTPLELPPIQKSESSYAKKLKGLIRETKTLESELYEAREVIKKLDSVAKEHGILLLNPDLSKQIEQHLKEHGGTKEQEHHIRIQFLETKLQELTEQKQILEEQRGSALATASIIERSLSYLDTHMKKMAEELDALRMLDKNKSPASSSIVEKIEKEIAKLHEEDEEDFLFDVRLGRKQDL